MKSTISKTKLKALLQACLSLPNNLSKTRRETVMGVALDQGFSKDEAVELACRVLTLWSAFDIVLDQYVEHCLNIN